ncbi:uncharacterized protein O3C94_020349 [Discoglossus pictus]
MDKSAFNGYFTRCDEEVLWMPNCDCLVGGTQGNACRKDRDLGICICKYNYQGEACDVCAPGYYGPNCQECQCTGPGVLDGTCDRESGQCQCRSGFEGFACSQCAPGFFNHPLCQLCGCSLVGTLPEGCDPSGRCFCKPEYDGPRCEQCIVGYHSYPYCQACSCDPRGSVHNICTPTGHCQCHPSYSGPTCNQCAPGFYGFPSCTPCHCSEEGSLHSTCDPQTGQCRCRPAITGLKCDSCFTGTYGFPNCEVGPCNPSGTSSLSGDPPEGSCECREHVEGTACDKCKPLYWNLAPENPQGCTRCQCGSEGTINGIEECRQTSGQCFCKPNICSRSCSTCKDGYYNLEPNSYFGCQAVLLLGHITSLPCSGCNQAGYRDAEPGFHGVTNSPLIRYVEIPGHVQLGGRLMQRSAPHAYTKPAINIPLPSLASYLLMTAALCRLNLPGACPPQDAIVTSEAPLRWRAMNGPGPASAGKMCRDPIVTILVKRTPPVNGVTEFYKEFHNSGGAAP